MFQRNFDLSLGSNEVVILQITKGRLMRVARWSHQPTTAPLSCSSGPLCRASSQISHDGNTVYCYVKSPETRVTTTLTVIDCVWNSSVIPQPASAYCDILWDIGVWIMKEGGGGTIVLWASFGFGRGDRVSTPRLEGMSTRQYSTLSTTTSTCAKSAFPEDNLDTYRRASPAYSLLKPRAQLTTDSVIVFVDYWALKTTQISDNRSFVESQFRIVCIN